VTSVVSHVSVKLAVNERLLYALNIDADRQWKPDNRLVSTVCQHRYWAHTASVGQLGCCAVV